MDYGGCMTRNPLLLSALQPHAFNVEISQRNYTEAADQFHTSPSYFVDNARLCEHIRSHDLSQYMTFVVWSKGFCEFVLELWCSIGAGSSVSTGVIGQRLILGQPFNLVYCAAAGQLEFVLLCQVSKTVTIRATACKNIFNIFNPAHNGELNILMWNIWIYIPFL